MSAQIPPELWLYIAEFIPDHVIYENLRTINSSFFHLAMDVHYRQIRIGWDPKRHTLPRIMTRLRDPFIARKVKHLIVEFVYGPKIIWPLANATKNKDRMIEGMTHWLFYSRYSPFKARNTRALEEITRIIGKLRNIVIFEISTNFNGRVGDVRISPTFMRNLSSIWSTIGTNLQSLSIGAGLLVLPEIAAMNPRFQSLTSLQISTRSAPDLGICSDPSQVNALATFINNFSPTLKKLSLMFSGLYQLPDLFCYLSKSLALEQLKIHTSMREWARDDSGLKAFLCGGVHNLRELDLNIRTAYWDGLANSTLSRLLLDCAADERCFSRLQSLKINPTGQARTDILCKAIQRASRNLRDLVIYDIVLSQEEALIVMDALLKYSHLTYIRLQIKKLDATIVDSMAKNLPGLKRLDIWRNVTGELPRDRHLHANLETRYYPEWKLEDISIYVGCSAASDIALMRALVRVVPAIKSFCGRSQLNEVRVGGCTDRVINK